MKQNLLYYRLTFNANTFNTEMFPFKVYICCTIFTYYL